MVPSERGQHISNLRRMIGHFHHRDEEREKLLAELRELEQELAQ